MTYNDIIIISKHRDRLEKLFFYYRLIHKSEDKIKVYEDYCNSELHLAVPILTEMIRKFTPMCVDEEHTCPSCKHSIYEVGKFCPYCGQAILEKII